MKIAFYHELPAGQEVGLDDLLSGRIATSGGAGRISLAVELAKLGVESTVFHHLQGGPANEFIKGVRSIRLACAEELPPRLVDHGRDDVLIVNSFDALPQLGARLAGANCRKIVWAGCNPPFDWCDLIDGKTFDRLICVSDDARECYRLHPNWSRIDYIYTALNSSFRLPRPTTPVAGTVAFLGGLREEKGFHHLLAAWPLVRAAEPGATLSIFGSIRLHFPDAAVGRTRVMTPEFERKYFDPLVGPAGDARSVGIEFTYPQPKPELFRRLASTVVGVVNPNLRGSTETYCLSAVEMQACGCPCIGGGIAGLNETIQDGVSGLHLKTQDPRELADKILVVLRDPGLRQRLSHGALAHSAKLASGEREARDWLRMIDRVNQGLPCISSPRRAADLARRMRLGRVLGGIQKYVRRTRAKFYESKTSP